MANFWGAAAEGFNQGLGEAMRRAAEKRQREYETQQQQAAWTRQEQMLADQRAYQAKLLQEQRDYDRGPILEFADQPPNFVGPPQTEQGRPVYYDELDKKLDIETRRAALQPKPTKDEEFKPWPGHRAMRVEKAGGLEQIFPVTSDGKYVQVPEGYFDDLNANDGSGGSGGSGGADPNSTIEAQRRLNLFQDALPEYGVPVEVQTEKGSYGLYYPQGVAAYNALTDSIGAAEAMRAVASDKTLLGSPVMIQRVSPKSAPLDDVAVKDNKLKVRGGGIFGSGKLRGWDDATPEDAVKYLTSRGVDPQIAAAYIKQLVATNQLVAQDGLGY